jgi:hypothetical protein
MASLWNYCILTMDNLLFGRNSNDLNDYLTMKKLNLLNLL